jgi:hypothetical protein
MSTKIHHGFRFRSRDLFEIHEMIARWRVVLADQHRADLAALVAGMAADTVDRNIIRPERASGGTPYRIAREEIRTRQKEILGSGSRDPEVDFDFELSILPFGGAVYGMAFCERPRWIDLWMEQGAVDDFSYWNNTDRPDGIAEDEWEERGRIWHDLLLAHPAGTPGMAGFTAQCADRMLQVSAEDILEALPSFEARVARQARNEAVNAVYVRMKEEGKDMSNPFSVYSKIERWLGGEGSRLLEEERGRVAGLLAREITREMIFEPTREQAAV